MHRRLIAWYNQDRRTKLSTAAVSRRRRTTFLTMQKPLTPVRGFAVVI